LTLEQAMDDNFAPQPAVNRGWQLASQPALKFLARSLLGLVAIAG
jgi:hypothetical protein